MELPVYLQKFKRINIPSEMLSHLVYHSGQGRAQSQDTQSQGHLLPIILLFSFDAPT